MQTKRTYQVQHWPDGQWNPEHNWRKIEAWSEKEAAEKVCGLTLTERGTLAQLRARPHVRRPQTAQRHVILRRRVGRRPLSCRALCARIDGIDPFTIRHSSPRHGSSRSLRPLHCD